MTSSKEYITIVTCATKLATALHSDRDIPHHLHAEGFITIDIYDDVINPRCMLSTSDKACELVSGIRRTVEKSPTQYHQLVTYLRENRDKYGDIAKILDEQYSKKSELSSKASCDSQASSIPQQPKPTAGMYTVAIRNQL